jgi:hypothetical protein
MKKFVVKCTVERIGCNLKPNIDLFNHWDSLKDEDMIRIYKEMIPREIEMIKQVNS